MFKSIVSLFRSKPPISDPIFIIGCARSGTTLLFQLMSSHAKLVPTTGYPDGEDHEGWIEHGKAIISGLGNPDINNGHTGFNCCLPMDEDDIELETRQNMVRHYSTLVDNAIGDRVINKCPHLSNKIRYVRSIFPGAKFVHIIRDCVPVVASLCKMMDAQKSHVLYWPGVRNGCLWMLEVPKDIDRAEVFRNEPNSYPGGGILSLVDYWSNVNTYITEQLSHETNAVLTIKYEDLCTSPQDALDNISNHCELEQFKSSLSDNWSRPIFTDKNASHNSYFDDSQIQNVLDRAETTRKYFGYC